MPLTKIIAFSVYDPNCVNRKMLGAAKTPVPLDRT